MDDFESILMKFKKKQINVGAQGFGSKLGPQITKT
jgi:hypothetical protein